MPQESGEANSPPETLNRVIPCQINKLNALMFQISLKLGRLIPGVKPLNHMYFGCIKLYGFGIISLICVYHFGHLALCS